MLTLSLMLSLMLTLMVLLMLLLVLPLLLKLTLTLSFTVTLMTLTSRPRHRLCDADRTSLPLIVINLILCTL